MEKERRETAEEEEMHIMESHADFSSRVSLLHSHPSLFSSVLLFRSCAQRCSALHSLLSFITTISSQALSLLFPLLFCHSLIIFLQILCQHIVLNTKFWSSIPRFDPSSSDIVCYSLVSNSIFHLHSVIGIFIFPLCLFF